MIIEWVSNVLLTASASYYVPVGMPLSGQTIVDVREFVLVTFGFYADQSSQIDVEGSNDASFATYEKMMPTLAASASTYTTPWDYAAPKNNTGFVVLSRVFIRFKLIDTSGIGHTKTEFYAKAC